MTDEYPRCRYCGRKIFFFAKRPYDAEIPEHLRGTLESFEWSHSGLHRHRCDEYFAAKAQEKDKTGEHTA